MEDILPIPPYIEIGKTGLDYQYGSNYEEFLLELRGEQGRKVYKEMATNDPIIGGVLFAFRELIKQVKWSARPSSTAAVDLENAAFLEHNMFHTDMTWSDTINEILSMLTYGWAFHEMVYVRRNGRIEWAKIAPRSQDSLEDWKLADNGDTLAFMQRPLPNFELLTIPIDKGLLFRTNVQRKNPEGLSILRNAYRPWFFKKKIEVFEGIGVERDLAGIPVLRIPGKLMKSDAKSEEQAAFAAYKSLAENIRLNKQASVVLPSEKDASGNYLYSLELLSSSGSKQFDTSRIIDRYKLDITISVLADFLLLGQSSVGSYSLASAKTKIFAMAAGSVLKSIEETFNRHAVPKLFALNGANEKTMRALPEVWHGDIEATDLTVLGDFIAKLASAGIVFSDEDEMFLREKAGLPFRSED